MTPPATAREALMAEAIGDVAKLITRIEAVAPVLDEACEALLLANTTLRDELAGFDRRMAAITENAKAQTVKQMAARADEAIRQSINQLSRAMADAARVAFGAEIGATIQRLQATLRPMLDRRDRSWEQWLTHAATAAAASAATWAWAAYLGPH